MAARFPALQSVVGRGNGETAADGSSVLHVGAGQHGQHGQHGQRGPHLHHQHMEEAQVIKTAF